MKNKESKNISIDNKQITEPLKVKKKYEELNIKYRLNDTPDMDKDRCKELENLLK